MIPQTSNIVERVVDLQGLQRFLPFFEEGRVALNDPHRARAECDSAKFMNMLAKVVGLNERGILLVLTSKNGKPLAFGCAFEAVDFNADACTYIWSFYSNGRCATAAREMLEACKRWTEERGYPCMRMATKRITGAAKGYFTNLGFKQEYLTFVQNL